MADAEGEDDQTYRIPTYEYRCSAEYAAGRDILQPMFIVEKKVETTKDRDKPKEKIFICAACSEICYDRSKAQPVVSYRETRCQCTCRKTKDFDKDRTELTIAILKHDGLVGVHAALLSAIVSAREALERARTFPVQDASELNALAQQLGPSQDLSEMIARAASIDPRPTRSAEMMGRVASAFLAREVKARIVVEIPLSSKPIPASQCRWQTQVYHPIQKKWEDVAPALAPSDPPKVTITVAFTDNGFVTALNVEALSAEVTAVFARKLLEYESLRRDVHENLRGDFSTSTETLELLHSAMGKAITPLLARRPTDGVVAELKQIYDRVTKSSILDGDLSTERADAVFKAILSMYQGDNESCEALSRALHQWNDCDVTTAAEYLQHVIQKWEERGSGELIALVVQNREVPRALEAVLMRPSHRATEAQLRVLEIMQQLYDKHSLALLNARSWGIPMQALAQAAERRGVTWSEPVAFLAAHVCRTALRAMHKLREAIPKDLCIDPVKCVIGALRRIAELRDPSTIVSLIESVKVLCREHFDGCYIEMARELLPVLRGLSHQTAEVPNIIDALQDIVSTA